MEDLEGCMQLGVDSNIETTHKLIVEGYKVPFGLVSLELEIKDTSGSLLER